MKIISFIAKSQADVIRRILEHQKNIPSEKPAASGSKFTLHPQISP
jgi:hypothetical protein